MRCRWTVLMLGLVLAGWPLGAAPVTELKVMSFNIWVQGGLSLNQCVEVIRTTGADLIGLQECNAVTAQTMAGSLGFYVLPATDCSILSRYPILASQPAGSSRAVTVLLSEGQRAHLFNCHLAAYPYGPYDLKNGRTQAFVIDEENQTRMPALEQLLDMMEPLIAGPEPCFLVGDFNAPSHLDYAGFPWPTSVACVDAGLADSYRELYPGNRTFPAAFSFNEPGITWTPKTSQEPEGVFDRIDFVHYSIGDGAVPTQSRELDEQNSINPWPSDHRAVITTFVLTPPAPQTQASLPVPPDGADKVTLHPTLTWLPGQNAAGHQVYFGSQNPLGLLTNTETALVALTNIIPGTVYYWRVDELTATGTVAGNVWSFTTKSTNAAVYEWDFAQGNLAAALGNGVLAYADGSATSNLTTFGTSDGVTVPHMGGKPVSYLHAPAFTGAGNGYRVTFSDSEPNGGGTYLNRFTLIYDLLLPAPTGWLALFNTNPNNANDADFYVDPNGKLGIADVGYTTGGTIAPNTWYRIAFAADLAAGTVRYFVDGNPVLTGSAGLDGRHSLYSNADPGPDLLLFNEGDASGVYTHSVYLSSFFFTDRTMSAAELLALGGPKARGVAVTAPPIQMAITLQGANLLLSWTGGEGPYHIQRTASLANPAWQTFGDAIEGTNATVTLESAPAFFRLVGQ